jgi:hypothetical protein
MAFATVELDAGHVTIVNTDQITYIREDAYGIAVHFSSGEHIVCPMELETLRQRLFGENASEELLILRA